MTENKEEIPEETKENQPEGSQHLLKTPIYLQKIEVDTPKNQQDYIRKLQFFEPEGVLASISEHNTLSLHKLNENSVLSQLETFFIKEYSQTVLYDLIFYGKTDFDRKQLVLSRKDLPIAVYSLFPDGSLTDVASLRLFKPNSERYLSPLSMKLAENTLFAGGPGFFFQYDLASLKPKKISTAFSKKEIVSVVEIPDAKAQNHELVKGLAAIGKFDKKLLLFSFEQDEVLYELKGHIGGVTHLKFMPGNNVYLFSGARKDNLVYLWDLRKTDEFLTFFERKCNTNQRMSFDVSSDGQEVFLGSQDGTLIIYNVLTGAIRSYFPAHDDCLNSVVSIPSGESQYLATSSGQRTFDLPEESSKSSDSEEIPALAPPNITKNSCLKLWRL